MTYEFIYEFMYMKKIVKSYLNSGVSRFQMYVVTFWYVSALKQVIDGSSGKTTPCQIPTYTGISLDNSTCDLSQNIPV